MSSLSPKDLDNFRSVFRAVIDNDGSRVGELFLDRSTHYCTDRAAFVRDMEEVVLEARRLELNLDRFNVGELLTKVFNTLLTHKVKLDASFSATILAIMVLEGLGKSLDPEMNIIMKAAPYLAGVAA